MLRRVCKPQFATQLFAPSARFSSERDTYKDFIKKFAENKVDKSNPAIKKFLEVCGEENVMKDFELQKKREEQHTSQLRTTDYQELVAYEEWYNKQPKDIQAKYCTPLELTGGKGRSLSLMDAVVDVPPGYNVTTAAYFQFVRDNPEVYKKIQDELSTLDTMDDQKRDVVTREIRNVIIAGKYPENIKQEVLFQYRALNYDRAMSLKSIPTTVAIRSSGTKEDIKVESWLPITTGSQAGQSDTYLNVKGEPPVLEKLQACWSSLFTDRATSYRDDAIFLIFSALIKFGDKHPKEVYLDMSKKIRQYGEKLEIVKMIEIADTLDSYKNPGYVNLMDCYKEVLKHEDNAEIKHCLKVIQESAQEVVHPQQIGIDVVIMQMVQSYISGVLFTVNPPTRQAGVAQALHYAWKKNDKSLTHLNKDGLIHSTKPILVSFEVAYGYGENVVGGKVDPDRFVASTYNGNDWFILEKKKGSKLIQMIDQQESLSILGKSLDKDKILQISSMVKKIVGYIEVGKQINGVLSTHLYGMKYFKQTKKDETESQKKTRLLGVANEISGKIKAKEAPESVKQIIKKEFIMEEGSTKGITADKLEQVVKMAYQLIEENKKLSDEGEAELANFLGDKSYPKGMIDMLREIWENNTFQVAGRKEILSKLNFTQYQFNNLSYLYRSLIDGTFTCNFQTYNIHREGFCITDEIAQEIARMAWNIACYYEEKMDVEFAIEIDVAAPKEKQLKLHVIDREGQVHKVKSDGSIEFLDKPIHLCEEKDATLLRLYNVQARPYTAGHATVDFVRERIELEEKFTNNLPAPLARGTLGDNATIGYTLVFDPNVTIDQHAEIVRRLKRGEFTEEEKAQLKAAGVDPLEYMGTGKKLPVVLYLLEADPSHDPLMRLVNAVVTIRGGETCHAAIFCREQGIPAVAGAGKFQITDGEFLVVNAIQGRLYMFKPQFMPEGMGFGDLTVQVKSRIKPYLIPWEKTDTKAGYILAAESVAQQLSPTMLAPDGSGIALARAEFKAEELGLNVVAGYAYDFILKMKEGLIKRADLNKFQLGIVEELEAHPWIIDQITEALKMNGYVYFKDFVENNFYYFYNNLGFHVAPDQVNKSRAYDFAQDKVQGLIGSEVFSWRGKNPLVGLRGASLEIKDVKTDANYNVTEEGYQDILKFLLSANIKANKNTGNQGWFYVFIRTARELKVLANILRKTGERLGALPSEVGIMVEVPSNVLLVEELGQILLELKKDVTKYGVHDIFFSFGTNDYTNLAGKTDREDPRIQNLVIKDPVAKNLLPELKKNGYFVDTTLGVIPMALEGADTLIRLVEHVCEFGAKNKITLSLCGQAIVKLVEMGLPENAGKIMSLLNSFGVDPKNRLPAGMLRFDSMRMLETVKTPVAQRKEVTKLGKQFQKVGVVQGECVFVDCDEDLIPDGIKGMPHDPAMEKLQLLKLNSPKESSRVGDKIVFFTGKTSNVETLEKKWIDWDDLQYARAIIVDPKIEWEKEEIFDAKRGFTPKRVKGVAASDLKALRSKLEGKQVTVDYNNNCIYETKLDIQKNSPKLRKFDFPEKDAQIKEVKVVKENANAIYDEIKYHPLILLAYRDGKLNTFEKTYSDHITSIFEEGQKISEEADAKKKVWLLKSYEQKVKKEYGVTKKFFDAVFAEIESGKKIQKQEDKLQKLCKDYFSEMKSEIEGILGGKKVDDFLTAKFKANMEKFAGKGPVVHCITSLNCVDMAKLKGGVLVEVINPNPDYGLLGASRALSDFWEINRMELAALKEVRQKHKDVHLQITENKGVQSNAIIKLWMAVLNDMGLKPGQDGLEVGVNISTPSDNVTVDAYLQEGCSFVTYDSLMLGAAWAGVDIYWDQWPMLAKREELLALGDKGIRYIKSRLEIVNREGKHGEKKIFTFTN